jgi:putative peptidoglycan lipid II flippase
MNRSSVTKAALGMGSVTAVSRSFGFLRVLVVAAILGTTYLGNTFQAANSFSNVLFELLAAGALSAVLVPTFVPLVDGDRSDEADRLAGGLLGVALVVLGAVAAVGMLASPLLARLLSTGAPNAEIAEQQQQLATFLLLFFIPQIVFYAFGAVATALLYARRWFAITSAAPIGNTLVMIAALVAFRAVAGPAPGFDLSTGEQLLLALAGTGGVIAFVGILVGAARRAGFSMRPRWQPRDPELRGLLRHSVWGVLLHSIAGLLLGAAIIAGNGVAGGVVAYQVAFVFFLAPYAVLAQPIHTAILPDLSNEGARSDVDAFARTTLWGLDRMALLVVPVSAALVAFALPMMRVVAFGQAAETGPALLAAGLASLAIGLFPYGAFLLFARASYALGDSRTPALVAIGAGVVGVVTMIVGSMITSGVARVAALGIGHSAAYLAGAVVLGVLLSRRVGHVLVPRQLALAVGVSVPLAAAGWMVERAIDPQSRIATAAVLTMIVIAGGAAYAFVVRRWSRAATVPRPLVDAA